MYGHIASQRHFSNTVGLYISKRLREDDETALMTVLIWQFLDKTVNELEMIARHLGHHANKHKE